MIRTFGRFALAGLMLGGLAINTYGVMVDSPAKDSEANEKTRQTLVSKILAESKEAKLDCEQLVHKIDAEIIDIDLKLDEGDANDQGLLAEREELVGYRLAQPCHQAVVTPVAPCCHRAVSACQCQPIVEEIVYEQPVEMVADPCLEEVIVEEPFVGAASCGYGSACGGGFGGGGGGTGGGGLGWGLVGLAGLAGLAGLDDDDEIAVVSQ